MPKKQVNRLQDCLNELNWSHAKLAEKTKSNERQIGRLVRGERQLTVEWLLKLCGAMNVTADQIVDIPVRGIDKAKCDPTLLDATIGFLMDACTEHYVKPGSKAIGKWTTMIYNDAIDLSLNIQQIRGMANTIVKAGKK